MSEDEELEEGELDDDDDGDVGESTPVATLAADTVKFHRNTEDNDEAMWKARSPTENQGHRLSGTEGRHDIGIVDLETSPADDVVVAQHLHGSSHRHGEARRRKHEAGNRAPKKGQNASYIDLDDFVDDPYSEDQTVSHSRGGQEYRMSQKLQSSKRTQNNVWLRSPRGAYDSPHSCTDSEPELLDITDQLSPERSDNDTDQWQYDMSGHPDRHGARRRHHRHHTAHSTGNSKDYEASPVQRGFSKDGAHSRSHRMLPQQQSRKRKLVDTPMDERPICRFFQEGKCSKGDDCPFNHECPPRKPEPCRFYLGTGCSKGDSCMYYHDEWPCRKYHRFGNCPLGSLCKFSHVELTVETRKLLDVPCEDEQQPPSDTSSIIEARKIPSLLDIVVYLPGTAPNQSPPGTVPRNLWPSLPIFKSQHFVELDEEINGDSQKPSVKQNMQLSSQGAGDDDIYYDLEDDDEQYSSEQQTNLTREPQQQRASNQYNATESVEDVEHTAEQLFDDCKEKSGTNSSENPQPNEIRELDTEIGDDVHIMDDDKLSRLPAAQRQLYFRIKNNQRQVDDAGISTEEKNVSVKQDSQNYRASASGNAIERNREDNWYSSDEDDDGSSKPVPMSSETVPVSPQQQQQNSAPVVSTNSLQQPTILFNVPPPPLMPPGLPPPMQSGVMAPPPFRIPPPLMQQQPSGPPPMGLAMRGMPPPGMAGASMSQNMMVPPFGQEVPPGYVRPVTGPRHLLPPGFVGPGSSPMTMPGQNSASSQGPPQPPVFGSQNMMGQGPLQPLLGPPAGNQPRMNQGPVPLLGPGPAGSQNFMGQGPPSLLGPGPISNQGMVNQGPQPLLGPSGGQGMLGHGVPSLLGPGGIGQGPQPLLGQGPQPLLGQGPPPLLGQGPGGNSNSMGPGPQPLSNQQQGSQTALGSSSGSNLLNQAINLPQFDIAQILSAIQNNMSTASSPSSTNNNDVAQTAGSRDIRTGNQLSNDPRLRTTSKASDSSEMTSSSSVVVSVLPPESPPASPTDDVEVNAGGQRVAYVLRKLTLTVQLPSVPAHVNVDELKERNDPRLGRYQVYDKTVAPVDTAHLFVTDSVVDGFRSDLNRQPQRSPPMYTLPDIVLPPLPLPGSNDAIPSAAKLAGKVPGLDSSIEMPKPLHERRTSTPADQSSDTSGPKKVIDYRNDPRYKKKKTLNPSKDAAVTDATFAAEQSSRGGGSSSREAFVSNYCRSSSTDDDDNAPGSDDFAVFGSYSDSDKRNARTGLAAAAGWNSQNDGSRSPSPPVFSANQAVAYPPLTVANSDMCEEDAVESDQAVSLKDMFKTIDPTTSPFC